LINYKRIETLLMLVVIATFVIVVVSRGLVIVQVL
jgi:hypothetical protein